MTAQELQKALDSLHSCREWLKIWRTALLFAGGTHVYVFGERFSKNEARHIVATLSDEIKELEEALSSVFGERYSKSRDTTTLQYLPVL